MFAITPPRAVLFAALFFLSPLAAKADPTPQLCEALAAQAGAEAGLPAGLLPAIARVESGKRTGDGVRAWPWTLNQGGKGSYHDSMDAALAHLNGILDAGIRNVDLGCMQLNWRWHSAAFPDAATMMDPLANTRYAAAFLRDLHARHGSWDRAVAHYHSTDPQRGTAYAARVAQVLDHIDTVTPVAAIPTCHGSMSAEVLPEMGCPRMRGLLLVAGGSLLAPGSGRDLRQAPDSANTPPVPRYLR